MIIFGDSILISSFSDPLSDKKGELVLMCSTGERDSGICLSRSIGRWIEDSFTISFSLMLGWESIGVLVFGDSSVFTIYNLIT